MAKALMISAGDVLEVQLTSETVVIETPQGRRPVAEPGHITNRMRLFVKLTDGKEQKFDFDDTELGVRQGQRVAIVRALPRRAAATNLILFNLSSGERDTFEAGLQTYLARTPLFGPMWQALGFALVVAVGFWLVSNFSTREGHGGMMSVVLALMFAFLSYPLFWWLCSLWGRFSARMRYQAERKRLIADAEAQVAMFAPGPAAG